MISVIVEAYEAIGPEAALFAVKGMLSTGINPADILDAHDIGMGAIIGDMIADEVHVEIAKLRRFVRSDPAAAYAHQRELLQERCRQGKHKPSPIDG